MLENPLLALVTPLPFGRLPRFSPYRVNQSAGDLGMIHGIDESIAVEDVVNGVAFYARLITLLGSEEL